MAAPAITAEALANNIVFKKGSSVPVIAESWIPNHQKKPIKNANKTIPIGWLITLAIGPTIVAINLGSGAPVKITTLMSSLASISLRIKK